jgi:hypothetical protein
LALPPATWVRPLFAHERDRALFAGIAAHSMDTWASRMKATYCTRIPSPKPATKS